MPTLVASNIGAGFASSRTVSINTTGADFLQIKVISAYSDGSQTPTSVTFNGSSTGISLHGSRIDATNRPSGFWYQLVAPTQTTANVVVSFNASTHAVVIVEAFSGVDQTTPLGTLQTAAASTGTAMNLTCTSGTADDLISDLAGLHKALDGAATVAVASSQTPTQNGTSNASSTLAAVGAAAYQSGGTSVACNYTASASSRWIVLAAPVKAAATGGGRLVGGGLVNGAASRRLLAG